jgi:acyl dehydratase
MPDELIRFSQEDLSLFSAASGDRNPLHLRPEYAARTSYGQRVVFGALGAVACLGSLPVLGGRRITGLTADFLRPMFLGVDYHVRTEGQDGEWITRLYDGSVLVVSLSVKAAAPALEYAVERTSAPFFERTDAAGREENGFTAGLGVSGRYACDPSALAALGRRWGAGAHPSVLAACAGAVTSLGWNCPDAPPCFPSSFWNSTRCSVPPSR